MRRKFGAGCDTIIMVRIRIMKYYKRHNAYTLSNQWEVIFTSASEFPSHVQRVHYPILCEWYRSSVVNIPDVLNIPLDILFHPMKGFYFPTPRCSKYTYYITVLRHYRYNAILQRHKAIRQIRPEYQKWPLMRFKSMPATNLERTRLWSWSSPFAVESPS